MEKDTIKKRVFPTAARGNEEDRRINAAGRKNNQYPAHSQSDIFADTQDDRCYEETGIRFDELSDTRRIRRADRSRVIDEIKLFRHFGAG